ncbi:hypothetical protein SR1949_32920 [Sphaerospermopsis reniformis]|uniref:Uncharacterized protein n=1 Tax=Sphaerospermopsis reniformis TaxID=531300 RepID=A0A480A3T6_9CYAN|nr:hypothetical protein SR1949_32920 [Sphaerospermopsis reniformis]
MNILLTYSNYYFKPSAFICVYLRLKNHPKKSTSKVKVGWVEGRNPTFTNVSLQMLVGFHFVQPNLHLITQVGWVEGQNPTFTNVSLQMLVGFHFVQPNLHLITQKIHI